MYVYYVYSTFMYLICFRYTDHYYEVRAGLVRRFSFSPQEQTREVAQVIVHDLYNRAVMPVSYTHLDVYKRQDL